MNEATTTETTLDEAHESDWMFRTRLIRNEMPEVLDGKAITLQELSQIEEIIHDVKEFNEAITTIRSAAERLTRTHKTDFYLGGDFSQRQYQEHFVNNYRQGITLECLVTEDVLVGAIEKAGRRTDLKIHNDEKMVKLHIRIPEDNLKEMYKVSQTK